jgi:hypothetical protein
MRNRVQVSLFIYIVFSMKNLLMYRRLEVQSNYFLDGSIKKLSMGNVNTHWCRSFNCASISSISTEFLFNYSLLSKISGLSNLLANALHFVHNSSRLVILVTIVILSEVCTQVINNLSIGTLYIIKTRTKLIYIIFKLVSCFLLSAHWYVDRDFESVVQLTRNLLMRFSSFDDIQTVIQR